MSDTATVTWVVRVERALHSFWVRVLLSLLILASLLPHPSDHLTDLLFLVVFGLELALRVAVFVNPPPDEADGARYTRRRALTAVSLVLDFVALLTFVPWAGLTGLVEARWLRLVRLLRMLLLIGYWSPILRDTWHVLTRHDRMRQVSLLGLMVGLLAFAGATVLAHIPVDHTDFNGDGHANVADASFWPRLWWAFRQVQDPGNMINDPGEVAVVIVSLLLTVAGLFVVSFLIGLATDIVRELVTLARNRPVGWKKHTVIVHATPGLPRLLSELMGYYEKIFRPAQFVVADQADEPPAVLRTGELARVRWRQIDDRGEGLTQHTDVATARRVVVLARTDAPFPDAQSAATVLDVREANAKGWVVVEVLDPNNAAAARVAGGARTVVVSSEKLLGIWALAAIRRPEQIAVAWDLLATRGGAEVYTCYYDADGMPGPGVPWLAQRQPFVDLVVDGLAMPQDPQAKRRHLGGVVPIGVVYQRAGGAPGGSHEDGDLVLGPVAIEARPVRALVAIGDQFDAVERVATKLHRGQLEVGPREAKRVALGAASANRRPPKKVLVCGFRPGTAVVCAGLLSESVDVEIVLVMRHEESVREAAQTLREHGLGESRGRCFAGRFDVVAGDRDGEARFAWVPNDGVATSGAVTLVRADWTSERTLAGLEPGVEHVSSYDLVLLMGAHAPEYDGRTSMACLKIANLARATPERFGKEQRVIAGIADTELGRRLEVSFGRATQSPRMSVLPTEDLRALFVFQSIAVPGWEAIFLELLGPGGKGLVRLPVVSGPETLSHAELARAVAAHGVLLAVEERDGARRYAPAPSDPPWSIGDIAAVWVLGDE